MYFFCSDGVLLCFVHMRSAIFFWIVNTFLVDYWIAKWTLLSGLLRSSITFEPQRNFLIDDGTSQICIAFTRLGLNILDYYNRDEVWDCYENLEK